MPASTSAFQRIAAAGAAPVPAPVPAVGVACAGGASSSQPQGLLEALSWLDLVRAASGVAQQQQHQLHQLQQLQAMLCALSAAAGMGPPISPAAQPQQAPASTAGNSEVLLARMALITAQQPQQPWQQQAAPPLGIQQPVQAWLAQLAPGLVAGMGQQAVSPVRPIAHRSITGGTWLPQHQHQQQPQQPQQH